MTCTRSRRSGHLGPHALCRNPLGTPTRGQKGRSCPTTTMGPSSGLQERPQPRFAASDTYEPRLAQEPQGHLCRPSRRSASPILPHIPGPPLLPREPCSPARPRDAVSLACRAQRGLWHPHQPALTGATIQGTARCKRDTRHSANPPMTRWDAGQASLTWCHLCWGRTSGCTATSPVWILKSSRGTELATLPMWVSTSSGTPVGGQVMLLGSPSTLKKPEGRVRARLHVVGPQIPHRPAHSPLP